MLDVTGLVALTDAAFEHFEGIKELVHVWLQSGLRRSLAGIQKLNMGLCSQANPHGCCFVHLGGILELKMAGCSQATTTDSAFTHLVGNQKLSIRGRTQVTDSQPLRTCRAFRS